MQQVSRTTIEVDRYARRQRRLLWAWLLATGIATFVVVMSQFVHVLFVDGLNKTVFLEYGILHLFVRVHPGTFRLPTDTGGVAPTFTLPLPQYQLIRPSIVHFGVPCWSVTGVIWGVVSWSTYAFWMSLERRKRHHGNLCALCGYSLKGIVSVRCPECGNLEDFGGAKSRSQRERLLVAGTVLACFVGTAASWLLIASFVGSVNDQTLECASLHVMGPIIGCAVLGLGVTNVASVAILAALVSILISVFSYYVRRISLMMLASISILWWCGGLLLVFVWVDIRQLM